MGADLVLKEGVGVVERQARRGADDEVPTGDHDPAGVLPDLDVNADVGVDRAIVRQFGLGEREELLGVDAFVALPGGGAVEPVEDGLGVVEELGSDGAVELDAERQEVSGVASGEHVQPQLELPVLRPQQVAEGAVLDVGDVHG